VVTAAGGVQGLKLARELRPTAKFAGMTRPAKC
jgi:hypothetical protein